VQPTPNPGRHPAPPPRAIVREPEPVHPVIIVFTPAEREVIRGYLRGGGDKHEHGKGKKGKGLPPGLAKKVARGGDLPPGWEKKCVRGERMSPEVYKQCEPLPQDVVVQLPPPPPGTIVVTLPGKAVRLAQATLEILDVFDVL
jgi:hypothetical protein